MKPTMMIGIVLIVLGIAGMVFQGVSYTTREKVVDLGGIQVTAPPKKTVPIPLIVGALALASGLGIIVATSRKSA